MSVEATCVTLFTDHCVQVPWGIHQCMSIQWSILQITTYYYYKLRTTYDIHNEWSHIVSYWIQFRRDKKKRHLQGTCVCSWFPGHSIWLLGQNGISLLPWDSDYNCAKFGPQSYCGSCPARKQKNGNLWAPNLDLWGQISDEIPSITVQSLGLEAIVVLVLRDNKDMGLCFEADIVESLHTCNMSYKCAKIQPWGYCVSWVTGGQRNTSWGPWALDFQFWG